MAITALPAELATTTWIPTTEAAAATGIPASTLRWWARSNTGPVRRRKIGRQWVWLAADLAELTAA